MSEIKDLILGITWLHDANII